MIKGFIYLLILIQILFAQDTGKLAGFISDKDTNEPVADAIIILEDFPRTGLSDLSGQYLIDNIPSGNYTITIEAVNYANYIRHNVEIDSGKMLIINFEMTEYMKAVFDEDEISSGTSNIEFGKTTINNEQLSAIPMDEFTDAFALWPGIAPFGESFTFRGSQPFRPSIRYFLDGVDITNLSGLYYSGLFLTDIPEGSFEGLQVLTGGYSVEFGNVLSGVVNIITKSNFEKASGFFKHKRTASEFGFGESFLKSGNFVTQNGSIEEAKLMGTGSFSKNDGYYGSPSKTYVNPGYNRYEFGFNAPLSINNFDGLKGKLLFGFYGDVLNKGGFLRGQNTDRQTYLGKLEYQFNPDLNLKLKYSTSVSEIRRYNHPFSRIVTTGDTLYAFTGANSDAQSNPLLVGSLVAPNGELIAVENYDMLENLNRPTFNSDLFSISLHYQINENLSGDLIYSNITTKEEYRTYDPWSGRELKLTDFWQTRFNNPAASDFFPPNAPTASKLESYWFIQPMIVEKFTQDIKQDYTQAEAKLSLKLKNHFIKFGFGYSEYSSFLDYQEFAAGGNIFKSYMDFRPRKFNVFLIDKLAVNSFLINAGIRYENIKPKINTNIENSYIQYDINEQALDYFSGNLRIAIKPFEKSIFYFDITRYATHPVFTQFNSNAINYENYFGFVPNFENKTEHVLYRGLGITLDCLDNIHVTMNGYLKMTSDVLHYFTLINSETGTPFTNIYKADFETIGFDINLKTNRIYNLLLYLNYTNQKTNVVQASTDPYSNRRPGDSEFAADWNILKIINFAFDYKLPEQSGIEIFGITPFSNSGFFILWKYFSGRPYTSPLIVPPPAVRPINEARFPSFSQIDLKLYKNFQIWDSIQAGLFIEIFNFTDERTLMDISNTEQYYLGSDNGDGTWNDPSVWSPPREVRFGFEVSF